MTDQYTDLNAQLRNLEATEDELRTLLGEVRAKPGAKAEDILAVHRNLTEIRGQIEQVQGRKNMLDNLISLATIHLSLTPDVAEQPIVEARWRPGVTVSAALRALVGALQSLGNLAIWLTLLRRADSRPGPAARHRADLDRSPFSGGVARRPRGGELSGD
ncbi:MAG: DUF4349 domain-containing protein [Caldilineaceae bacterium]